MTADAAAPKMSAGEMQLFLAEHFSQIAHLQIAIEAVAPNTVRARLPIADMHLRPGGTVSRPSMMQLADLTLYMLLLAALGPAAGPAATSSMSMNFLRRPAVKDVLAEGRLLRLGRRLAVGEVTLFSDGEAEPVALAVFTYALPGTATAR